MQQPKRKTRKASTKRTARKSTKVLTSNNIKGTMNFIDLSFAVISRFVKKVLRDARESDGVWQSKDFDAFKLMFVNGLANREIDFNHVNLLAEDMMKRGFRSVVELGLTTIFSEARGNHENELKILDGQHRILAAIQCYEMFGKVIKIKFSVVPITSKESWARDHIQAQKLVRKQSITDYIAPQSFAGNGDYQKFETIFQHYRAERKGKQGFGRELLMLVMTGAYGGMNTWKNGSFKIKRGNDYIEILKQTFELQDILDIRNVPQMRSVVELVMHPQYNHNSMKTQIVKFQQTGRDLNLRDKDTLSADLYKISKLNPIKIGKPAKKKRGRPSKK